MNPGRWHRVQNMSDKREGEREREREREIKVAIQPQYLNDSFNI